MPRKGGFRGAIRTETGQQEKRVTLAAIYRKFKQDLDDQGVIFSFSGYLSEDVLVALGDALKQRMALEETNENVVKRVFSVFVEQVQNIIRYSSDRLPEGTSDRAALSSGMVTVGFEDGRFFVVCGNMVDRSVVEELRTRLAHLVSLDRDAIRRHYREQLRRADDDDLSRGNIGLIEIVRRASAPVEYDFADEDAARVFFCLKAFI